MYLFKIVCLTAIFASFAVGSSQRFTNLDRLLNRLDGSTEEPSTASPPATPGHKIRHAHRHHNQPNLQNQDDEELEEDEKNMLNEPQADIHNRAPFTSSVNRWKDKPSRKNMDKFWQTYRNSVTVKMTGGEEDSTAHGEAKLHHEKVVKEARCKIPQPRVVKVSDHHPSASKTYVPSCTLLHQCADDTGCCPATQRCGPKDSKMLELYFYATYNVPGITGHHPRKALRIEKLTFYNHTECECQDKRDDMPRDTDPKRLAQHLIPYSKCKCPSQYSVRILSNGSCTCDCFDKQTDCTKYKKGKVYFNHSDRLCIEMNTCNIPACDFGDYIRRSGRCPRKLEKYRPWEKYKV